MSSRSMFAVLLLLIAGCDSPTRPRRATEDLTFLRLAENAPALANTSVTFTAMQGEDAEARIYFVDQPDDDEFLRFKVHGDTRIRRPNGQLLLPGETIDITIRIVDMQRLIFEFEPSGLRFEQRPAELKLDFEAADDDLDEDGDIDAEDDDARRLLSWWRQEAAGTPWFRQASVVFEHIDEIEADIFGFTNYAVAY